MEAIKIEFKKFQLSIHANSLTLFQKFTKMQKCQLTFLIIHSYRLTGSVKYLWGKNPVCTGAPCSKTYSLNHPRISKKTFWKDIHIYIYIRYISSNIFLKPLKWTIVISKYIFATKEVFENYEWSYWSFCFILEKSPKQF